MDDSTTASTAVVHTNGADAGRAPLARRAETSADLSPMALLHIAVQTGTKGEELEKLIGLAYRHEDRNARKAFFVALRKFQQECPPVKKNKTAQIPTKSGRGYSFTYAELDEIERHVKPYLEANDLSYNFDTVVDEKGVMLTNICTLRHIDGHSEQSRFTLPTASDSAMTAQQRFSAANNFAKRQTLANVLGVSITDKEVPDEDVSSETITEEQALELSTLLNESGSDREKFLHFFNAESVLDIAKANYPVAKSMLADKLKAKQRKEREQTVNPNGSRI